MANIDDDETPETDVALAQVMDFLGTMDWTDAAIFACRFNNEDEECLPTGNRSSLEPAFPPDTAMEAYLDPFTPEPARTEAHFDREEDALLALARNHDDTQHSSTVSEKFDTRQGASTEAPEAVPQSECSGAGSSSSVSASGTARRRPGPPRKTGVVKKRCAGAGLKEVHPATAQLYECCCEPDALRMSKTQLKELIGSLVKMYNREAYEEEVHRVIGLQESEEQTRNLKKRLSNNATDKNRRAIDDSYISILLRQLQYYSARDETV